MATIKAFEYTIIVSLKRGKNKRLLIQESLKIYTLKLD